jgi:gamma-glutamyltranspeptidase
LIQSLFSGFGSGVVGGDTGVMLHNRGSYFSLDPRHVNYLQPGKRTMHTLTPAMVLRDGKPYMAVGSMGGDAQPQIHVQLLSDMLDFGMNAQQAITAPRWRSGPMRINPTIGRREMIQGQRGVDGHLERDVAEVVMLENRFPDSIPFLLDLLGHRTMVVGPWEDGMGHAQAIVIDPSSHLFEGAADPRCDGLALGW